MNQQQFITYSRGTFSLLRWAPLVAAAALPFTFDHGRVSTESLVWAPIIAAAWLVSLLLAWRTRNQGWLALSFAALVVGSRLVGIHDSEVPFSQFLQWLCCVVILAGVPLLFFRERLLHFARLDKPDVTL